jgi:hypothetical protein
MHVSESADLSRVSMYVCIYIHVSEDIRMNVSTYQRVQICPRYVYIYICICLGVYMYANVCMYVSTHGFMYVCMYVLFMYVFLCITEHRTSQFVCLYVYTFVCACVSVYTCACMHKFMCLYTYIHA